MGPDARTETGASLWRALQVRTFGGQVEGWLQTSPLLRTLDDLNVVSRDYLVLRDPRGDLGAIRPRGGRLAINKATVLFVSETPDSGAPVPARVNAGLFSRAAVALWVGGFQVSGFVHVPRGGVALARLNQVTQPFIAVTSASVTGPGVEMELPFVAVNRARVDAAEDLLPDAGAVAAVGSAERDA
jgi:hypothetical protein